MCTKRFASICSALLVFLSVGSFDSTGHDAFSYMIKTVYVWTAEEKLMSQEKSTFVRKFELAGDGPRWNLSLEAIAEYRAVVSVWAKTHGIDIPDSFASSERTDSTCLIHTTEGTSRPLRGGGFSEHPDRVIDDVLTDDSHD